MMYRLQSACRWHCAVSRCTLFTQLPFVMFFVAAFPYVDTRWHAASSSSVIPATSRSASRRWVRWSVSSASLAIPLRTPMRPTPARSLSHRTRSAATQVSYTAHHYTCCLSCWWCLSVIKYYVKDGTFLRLLSFMFTGHTVLLWLKQDIESDFLQIVMFVYIRRVCI